MEQKDIDFVICPICNKQLKVITIQHIRMHGFNNFEDFLLTFPNQILTCKNTKDKNSNSCKGNTTRGQKIKESRLKNGSYIAWNKGKTKETDERIAKYGKKLFGVPIKLETKEKIRNTLIGITNIQRFGEEKAKEISEKKSETLTGHKVSKETKMKIRLIAVQRVLLNNGYFPGYNKKACEFFKKFDELNKTQGQYATSPNEFYIKELGYWLDYINFDLKLIIEHDEPHHFEKSGELKAKDIQRQKEIQELYHDFKFLRFKKKEINKILEIKIK